MYGVQWNAHNPILQSEIYKGNRLSRSQSPQWAQIIFINWLGTAQVDFKKVRPQQHGLSNIQQLSSVHMIESRFYWIGNPLAEMLILDVQNLKSLQISKNENLLALNISWWPPETGEKT